MPEEVSQDFKSWVAQQVEEGEQEGWYPGSPREDRLLNHWRTHSPRMFARLEKAGIAENLASVLDRRQWRANQAYVNAGMPPTDAEEQSEKEWLLKEPESETLHDPLLNVPISTSPTRKL